MTTEVSFCCQLNMECNVTEPIFIYQEIVIQSYQWLAIRSVIAFILVSRMHAHMHDDHFAVNILHPNNVSLIRFSFKQPKSPLTVTLNPKFTIISGAARTFILQPSEFCFATDSCHTHTHTCEEMPKCIIIRKNVKKKEQTKKLNLDCPFNRGHVFFSLHFGSNQSK